MPRGYEHIYANYSKCFVPTLSIIGIFQKTKLLQNIEFSLGLYIVHVSRLFYSSYKYHIPYEGKYDNGKESSSYPSRIVIYLHFCPQYFFVIIR